MVLDVYGLGGSSLFYLKKPRLEKVHSRIHVYCSGGSEKNLLKIYVYRYP